MNKAARGLLANLGEGRLLLQAKELVRELEKEHGFRWRAVGDRENNFGTINIGSDPGYGLIERVTNAIDAVIEREAVRRAPKVKSWPASPREAAEEWFGIPGGRVNKLDLKQRQKLADNIVIRLLESGAKKQPTLEVRDLGIGLTGRMFPRTILSLNESNKVDKPYLAGAFGQGGSTALAFSPGGTLFVSRRQKDLLPKDDADEVAVTFARYNPLDFEKNKNGRYEYLVGPDNEVASIEPALLKFDAGTSVVHFNLDIAKYSEQLTQLTNSLWWLLQNALFDPVLPYWAEDHRPVTKGEKALRRTIAGNFARLADDKREKIEHYDSVSVNLSHSTGATSVQVNYWVLKSDPENKGASPIDAYVDPYKPIAFTFHGQTHGTEERRFISDRLDLPHLTKYLIIQTELDGLSSHARRDLLSATRDRLKQLPFYEQMRECIATALSEDQVLHRLNQLRKEELLSRHSEAEEAKMQQRFAKLMEKFKAGIDTSAPGKGGNESGRKPKQSGTREELQPLPTKDKPTFIRIANVQKPVSIRLDRHGLLRLESDAPDDYLQSHVHANLVVSCEPEGLVAFESRSDFRGGRARATVRPAEKAKAGDEGTLTVFLFTPEGKSFNAKTSFRLEMPEASQTAGNQRKAQVQIPKPIPVRKVEWKKFSWDEMSVARVDEDKTETLIFVNLDNRHIVKLLQANYQDTGIKRMSRNFLLYTAFYSWVQHAATRKKEIGLEGKPFEDYMAAELDRVAQTVSYAISAVSRLEDED